jgi:hypothetical protein
MIVRELGQAGRKQLRLSNKYLCGIATPYCFRTVRFELREGGLDHLLAIASHEELRQHVERLVLRRSRGLREFPDFDSWERGISLDRSSDADSDTDSEDGDDDDLMLQQDWLTLSTDEKHALYHEYEADCLEARARARSLTNYLYFRTLGCKRGAERVHPARATAMATLDSALEHFDEAVARLTNLTAFVHQPAYLFDSRWGTRWRRLRISPDRIILDTSDEEDEDEEALQLSYVLRALGWANYFNRNLRSLSMYVGGPAFWGAEPLQCLWDGHEDSTMRSLRYAYLGGDGQTRLRWELHLRQLFIMEHAFVHLTDLDCHVSEEEGGSLAAAAGPLFEFLRRGESLERVHLALSSCQRENGAGELLARLARHAPWPRIRELELELVTDERALVGFLSTLVSTLRRLALSNVTLVPSGGTWESALRQIASALRLDSLELLALCDHAAGRRVILDPQAHIWRTWDIEGVCYGHYGSAVVGHLLGRVGELPQLEPAAFLREHIRNCESGTANRSAWIQERKRLGRR